MSSEQDWWSIGSGEGWSFLNGQWTDGDSGELIPPDGTRIEYLAVREDRSYSDFSADFRFKFRSLGGGARLMFRIQDSRRFYALDVPVVIQQFRSRHFWAGMVVADGLELQRYLNFGLVPGLCARIEHWYEARVQAVGPRLRAWIDGILVADVEDDTYRVGRLGIGALNNPYRETPHFTALTVDGEAVSGPNWPGLEPPRPHWITPCRETDPNTYQSYANMIQSKSGQVTLYLTFGDPNRVEVRRAVYIRSKDGGRTWAEPEPVTLQQGLGAPFVRKDGTWVCIFSHPPMAGLSHLYAYESRDEGRTWEGPVSLEIQGDWPDSWTPDVPWRPVRMHDGVLILPVISHLEEPLSPSLIGFFAAFVLRSEDEGRTWSAPVHCDAHHSKPGQPLGPGAAGGLIHAARYFELGIDEVADNVLMGIGRPERDPYMWQIQSNDGGRTWEPAALGHFPGYCPSLTRTDGGAVVATTRFPYFAAYLSRDRGRTWEPPVIVDYCGWANQQAFQVEPDVVLVTYMGPINEPGQADSRIARLQVTDEGLHLDHP